MNSISFPKLGIELNLNNVAFQIGDFQVYWYGILIGLGLILAILYAYRNSNRFGVDNDRMFEVIIGGLIGGIVGARLYYVIFSWDMYKDDLLSIFSTRSGGLAIYGGIIGALLVGGLVCKFRKVKLAPMFDLAGLGFLIGQGIGRWGNFFNIEAYGCNTNLPWGMFSPKIQSELYSKMDYLNSIGMSVDPTQPVHPTFLYESIWCLAGFVLLHIYSKRRKFDGEVFLMYLAWYGFERCIVEGLRTDSLMLGPIRVSQLLAGVLVVLAVIAIILIRRKYAGVDHSLLYADSDEWKQWLAKKQESESKTEQAEKIEQQQAVSEGSPVMQENVQLAEQPETDSTDSDEVSTKQENQSNTINESQEEQDDESVN